MGAYLRPERLTDALGALATTSPGGGGWTVVAGATDHYPARVGRPARDDVLDVTALGRLRGIEAVAGGWRIGALATWAEIAEADLPPLFDGLRAAAGTIGGRQIQARGTVLGNVCNASPAADGVPNLLALDGQVELSSQTGARIVPIGAFVLGNRRTDRRPDELATALFIPEPIGGTSVRSAFEKLGSRAYLVISIAMVAAVAEIDPAGVVTRARIAVGACSEVAQRLPQLEGELAGERADAVAASLGTRVLPEHLAALRPIDDVRGSAAYRREAALELVRRALARVLT